MRTIFSLAVLSAFSDSLGKGPRLLPELARAVGKDGFKWGSLGVELRIGDISDTFVLEGEGLYYADVIKFAKGETLDGPIVRNTLLHYLRNLDDDGIVIWQFGGSVQIKYAERLLPNGETIESRFGSTPEKGQVVRVAPVLFEGDDPLPVQLVWAGDGIFMEVRTPLGKFGRVLDAVTPPM